MYEIHHNSIIDLFRKDYLELKARFCQLIPRYTVKMVSWQQTRLLSSVLRRVYLKIQSRVFMQDMFKGNVSVQDTHTEIMSSCKTFQFRKTCLLSLVGRHDLLKNMSSCLKMHFYCFYFLCFILLKTCLFPRHVLNMAPRHDFYSVV